MIYNNLFKPNKSSQSKTKLFYLISSRKYKFSFIFNKKSVSIISGISLGAVIILVSNMLFYTILNTSSKNKIRDLSDDNSQYETSISKIDSLKSEYDDIEKSVNIIYNLSEKGTKWSKIVESIALQLPYDSVLTSIESVSQGQIDKMIEDLLSDSERDELENQEELEEEFIEDEFIEEPVEGDVEAELNELINSGEPNNIVLISGKSLSMVNLSLFLDKLDGLHIFSKVESMGSVRNYLDGYYDFVIYATLK